MIEDFFNHLCNIYHIKEDKQDIGYGISSTPIFSYSVVPDAENVKCHFSTKSPEHITEADPEQRLTASVKLVLPIGTDVRINDKILDVNTGIEYTAEMPKTIQKHHKYVMCIRKTIQDRMC